MEGARPALQMRTNGVVFEGGDLWGPWVPAEANMREIEGSIFYAVRKTYRHFAIVWLGREQRMALGLGACSRVHHELKEPSN